MKMNAYFSDITVTNIIQSFTQKMAVKTSCDGYETKLRHGHPMYNSATVKMDTLLRQLI